MQFHSLIILKYFRHQKHQNLLLFLLYEMQVHHLLRLLLLGKAFLREFFFSFIYLNKENN